MLQSTKPTLSANPLRTPLNVERAINDLDDAVERLSAVVSELEDRLAPLLSAAPLCSEPANRGVGDSAASERILANADSISRRADLIRELIDRL